MVRGPGPWCRKRAAAFWAAVSWWSQCHALGEKAPVCSAHYQRSPCNESWTLQDCPIVPFGHTDHSPDHQGIAQDVKIEGILNYWQRQTWLSKTNQPKLQRNSPVQVGFTLISICPLLYKIQHRKNELAGNTSWKSVLGLRVLKQKQKYKEVVLISRFIRHRGHAPVPSEVKLSLIIKFSLVAEVQDQSMEKE